MGNNTSMTGMVKKTGGGTERHRRPRKQAVLTQSGWEDSEEKTE